MNPIKAGTASRLGLRKPTGVYRYKDGTTRWLDEMVPWIEKQLGVKVEPFQRAWLNEKVRVRSVDGLQRDYYLNPPWAR